jgi:hypothetical protein
MNPETDLEPVLVGCKEASVFPGFCGFHDNHTFKPIDDREFAAAPEQIFLLSYRALCREVIGAHTKAESFPHLMKLLHGQKGPKLEERISYFTQHQILTDYNLRQVNRDKSAYDELLLSSQFEQLQHYVIWLDRIPDMLCTMFIQPWSDFNGNVVQPLPNLEGSWQSCAFSIVALDGAGAAIFSWHPTLAPDVAAFIKSLHQVPEARLTDALIRLAFEYSDNVCLAPTWWQRLQQLPKQALLRRFKSGISDDRHKDCLLDDGIRFANWKPSRRQTNAQL